ncbi:selenocysteine lyase/cysteine desulfurase [Hamadaea flava]|uniref:Aminotransferase class V-fold PLP-dependent enzyme n=1 Tax=Hamadaea flava TaxID=1742688 RepID=A0ABV8LJM2_9ACTN|nr:aminotransferase class V-fold PLP-dependent enzyme [Hamadaea flava]MCP2323613.1 selenocysteine lyase/cysteine desulfurase [Hamadaea flava]
MNEPDLTLDQMRELHPNLQYRVHLATCSIAPPSTPMTAAMHAVLAALLRPAWTEFENTADYVREHAATLLGAATEQIALVPNVSIGAYQVASTQRWRGARRRVLVCASDFPGIAHVWLAQQVRGCEVVFVDTPPGTNPVDAYRAVLDERTAIVCAPLVTYRDGLRLPIADLARHAHAVGAKLLVDASQAVGVMPVDVASLDCDYLVTATSKYLLGLPGLALLYVRRPAAGPKPTLTGWQARQQPFDFDPLTLDWPPSARRLETGTPAVAAIYGAVAGLQMIGRLDLSAVHQHVTGLVNHAAQRLRSRGERLTLPNPEHRGAHLVLHDASPQTLAHWLERHNILTAPRAGILRIAFHAFNNHDDVNTLCDAIEAHRSTRTAAAAGVGRVA